MHGDNCLNVLHSGFEYHCWNRKFTNGAKLKKFGLGSSFFPYKYKWKGNDNSIWLWPRLVTFVKSIFIGCCVFHFQMTKRWVVLIFRPHAVMLSWHTGFDKPLQSAVWLLWQEASRGTARHQSSWITAARLQGLASICYTRLCCLYGAEAAREWLCQFWFMVWD